MINTEKALNAIRYHIGCDWETAKLIFNGVFLLMVIIILHMMLMENLKYVGMDSLYIC